MVEDHYLHRDGCAVDFFSGALLGNGGLGCVVTTRPDSLLIHLGNNDVWDIRREEVSPDELGTFTEIFEKLRALPKNSSLAGDQWFKDYFERTGLPYTKPYPRPFPCGSLLLGYDRRSTQILGHVLDIATGVLTVEMTASQTLFRLRMFCDQLADRLWLWCEGSDGTPSPAPLTRVRLMPDSVATSDLPPWKSEIDQSSNSMSLAHDLPALPVRPDGKWEPNSLDRFLHVTFRTLDGIGEKYPDRSTAIWNEGGMMSEYDTLHRRFYSSQPFVAVVEMRHGLNSELAADGRQTEMPDLSGKDQALVDNLADWREFWSKSAVELEDELLESVWYRNLYFFHCATRSGRICPGLFANWSYRHIGTAWHGDWHLNYNTQQPFWVAFTSNHLDHHLPYVAMVEHVAKVARWTADKYFGLPGEYYPHCAYPVEMNTPPYLVPTWGWELCETPWTVQSLWWHYLYSQDVDFLRLRAYPRLKAATEFMTAFLERPAASGHSPEGLWNDDRVHIFPTVVPELHGLERGFAKNFDCIADIALTQFLFKAWLDAVGILQLRESEGQLVERVQAVLRRLPDYPTAEIPEGRVFCCMPGDDPEIVQNVPVTGMPVFPGEQIGLGSPGKLLETARNTYRATNIEGGNELVFLNFQAARLGILNLEDFKRQIRMCMLPNGSCANVVLQSMGRYHDTTQRDWMAKFGVWFENFSLPAVINECLMQSYDGVIRLFPNWPPERGAGFTSLRAAGAFLVSSRLNEGVVEFVDVASEKGGTFRMICPWPGTFCFAGHTKCEITPDRKLELPMIPGQALRITAALTPPPV